MKPIFLYLENFICFSSCELDLTSFSSALIIGMKNNNDLLANGVGKSSIFKAIEFCIFNECAQGVKLEKLIRDDQQKCKVIFDFESDGNIYRVSRSRTKKGITDLSLFRRNSYVEDGVNPHRLLAITDEFKKFWDDISSRRTPDTEEDLQKIHKINHDGFSSSYYFAQHDYRSGLATSTKGGRKDILKASLSLIVYTFLQKLASARSSILLKEIDKKQIIFNSIGNVIAEISSLEVRLVETINQISEQEKNVLVANEIANKILLDVNELKSAYKKLFDQLESLIKRRKDISDKLRKSVEQVTDFTNKRKTIIAAAKTLTSELSELKKLKEELSLVDISTLSSLKEELDQIKHSSTEKSALISAFKSDLVKLNIPLPDDGFCKHCRQVLTDAHRRACVNSNNDEIKKKEQEIANLSGQIADLTKSNRIVADKINKLEITSKKLETTSNQINAKNKELTDKRALYTDYDSILNKYKLEFDEIKLESDQIEVEFNNSNSKELDALQKQISSREQDFHQANRKHTEENSALNKLNNQKAVIEHNISEKTSNLQKKNVLQKEIEKLEEEHSQLPFVIEAFGPTGIPNLIIQDVLDELQIEANAILEKIKPGLQLAFSIEKTRGDGQLDDDLDINYFLNGKQRDYGILSGGEQVSIMFSLKLGVAYLLKNKIGSMINMLLIDEIDQALDKASIDTLAEIIKYFQKDFTILVITHNDRLKDKFSHAILVEQDQNMTSTARIVTSW